MDEQFLESRRREPRPEFARSLRGALARIEDEEASGARWRPVPLLATAAGLAVVVGLFTLPSVRVSAQAMLDFFRVREFSIVQVDEARVQQLRERNFDPASLISGNRVVLQDPGPPRHFASLEAASAATGLSPVRPALLPRGLVLDTVIVNGESRSRATVTTKPLADLMDAFDVRDLALPAGLEGGTVEVHIPPVIVERFRGTGRARAAFVQCAGPEVALPAGVDLARLGEIGLRLMGMPALDAHRLAGRIDWRSTLIVPVVSSATSFQQVDVNGAHGVFVETNRAEAPGSAGHESGSAVIWSRQGRVYAIMGNLDRMSLMQMAESIH